jgi:hypothetical protein
MATTASTRLHIRFHLHELFSMSDVSPGGKRH